MEFMPQHAPWVFLALLFTGFALAVASIALVGAWLAGMRGWTGKVLVGGIALAGVYLGILLAFSFSSRERVLRSREQKYFCEVDCHEAYSVERVTMSRTLGTSPNQATARGIFYVVTVKVWFDERTISTHRGDGPLTPNPHEATVVDDHGRQYGVSADGQAALERDQGPTIPFTQPIRPGQSHTTTLVFDLPADIPNPLLYITTEPWLTRFMIGHENSFFHQKVYFELQPGEKQSTASISLRASKLFRKVIFPPIALTRRASIGC